MTNLEFRSAFERRAIPGAEFRHTEHVRLAWIYLHDSEFADGAALFCKRFREYLSHNGAEGKYHETITWFFLVAIFGRIRTQTRAANWDTFASANPELHDRRMAFLRCRYRTDTLNDPLARAVFVLPDLSQSQDSNCRNSSAAKTSNAGEPGFLIPHLGHFPCR